MRSARRQRPRARSPEPGAECLGRSGCMRQARFVFRTLGIIAVILSAVILVNDAFAQEHAPDPFKAFEFRAIGPTPAERTVRRLRGPRTANRPPSTRPPAPAACGSRPTTASPGSRSSTASRSFAIGDIAVAPSNPKVVYVGTGEHTTSRSTYWGDGVYKSTDAGKTWANMGLKESQHIGRDHRRSEESRHRLRGGARQALLGERRTGRLQEHRRREDVDEVARRQDRRPRDRGGGSRHGSA